MSDLPGHSGLFKCTLMLTYCCPAMPLRAFAYVWPGDDWCGHVLPDPTGGGTRCVGADPVAVPLQVLW